MDRIIVKKVVFFAERPPPSQAAFQELLLADDSPVESISEFSGLMSPRSAGLTRTARFPTLTTVLDI